MSEQATEIFAILCEYRNRLSAVEQGRLVAEQNEFSGVIHLDWVRVKGRFEVVFNAEPFSIYSLPYRPSVSSYNVDAGHIRRALDAFVEGN